MSDPLLTWCDDLHQVRGNVSQLQATLNSILAKAPNVKQYQQLIRTYDTPEAVKNTTALNLLEKLRGTLNSPQIKVAVRLKTLFDKGYLPFLLALSRINFKSGKSDKYVGYFLDYTPAKVDLVKIGLETEKRKGDVDQDVSTYPPTLPPIDSSLLKLVLTDKSLRQPSDFLESENSDGLFDFNNRHNRKLALRGKSLLNMALVEILDEAFPKAHEDDLEYLKLKLMSTLILAKLAYCYNFTESLLHHVSKDAKVEDKLVIFKNAFLAYLGAMSKDGYSVPETTRWIDRLYHPLVVKVKEESEKSGQLKNVFALAFSELNFLLVRVNSLLETPTKKIKHNYKALERDDQCAFQLELGDLQLGSGVGSTVLEAKQRAAYNTLESSELRSQLMDYLFKHFKTSSNDSGAEQLRELVVAENADNQPSEPEDEAYSPGLPGDDYDPEVNIGTQLTSTASQASMPADHAQQTVQEQYNSPMEESKSGYASQTVSSQARMPLPYGMLPPIPNMKKKGGK